LALSRRVGRSRFTLVLLILTSITLVTLDFRGFGPIDTARSAVLSAFAPVGDAASSAFRPVGNFWHGAFEYDDLKRENDDLRSQLLEAQGQVTSDQITREQYQQLLTQLNLPFLGDLPTAKAKVVSGAIANFGDTIEIDKGTNDKIKVNMSVTAGLGLVGIVVQTSPDRSVVRLVTDSSFNVGVTSVPFNAVGVAHGQGTNHRLEAQVNAGQPVLPGNVLVTQGGPKSLYPQGIPVGTVATVSSDAALLTQNLDVDLMVNLNDLAYVSVVLWEPAA
jgi:rod shape-determining protein MreC